MEDFNSQYNKVMEELQREWEHNRPLYLENRNKSEGVRSSQIAAVIGLLIKKGILKGGNHESAG